MAEPDIDEALLGAKCARQPGFRLESQVQCDDIDVEVRSIDARPRARTAPVRRRSVASLRADHNTGTPARFSVVSMPMPSRTRSGAGRVPSSRPDASAPDRDVARLPPPRAASHRTARSSQASCRFSGPLPAISTRSPGQTRCARTSVCNEPVVITPGSVQPGSGTGRSCAPGARTSRRGPIGDRGAAATSAAISSAAKPPQTVASVSMRAPAARARVPQVDAEAELCVGRGHPHGCRQAVWRYWPPVALRSSSTTTDAPASAAAMAADNPAGPPPTTSTSHDCSCGLWRGRFVAERRQRQLRLAGHFHAVRHLGHAGALADAAVHGHDAVEARSHAAMQAARCAGQRASSTRRCWPRTTRRRWSRLPVR